VPGVIGMANNIFTFSTAIYFMINPNEGCRATGSAAPTAASWSGFR